LRANRSNRAFCAYFELDCFVALLLAMTIYVSPAGTSVARAETPLERGAYLVNGIVACGNCHTPKDANGKALADQELAGGLVIEAPVFHAVASNITPDKATGIGGWSDEQIIDAIRNGKRPDGTIIGPPMPIDFYRNMSDSDARAIVAYLRSVKPIEHRVAKSTYKMPLPSAYGPTVTHVADVPAGNKVAYGHYLSNIAHCMECHTPMSPKGEPDMTRVGAGGRELPAFPSGMVTSANLTPANPDGIAHWTNAQVKQAITGGVRPDGRKLVLLMAFDWYKHVRPADLDAVVAYLRTLKPAKP
jgi:mono/diheme cytochrome c family protein